MGSVHSSKQTAVFFPLKIFKIFKSNQSLKRSLMVSLRLDGRLDGRFSTRASVVATPWLQPHPNAAALLGFRTKALLCWPQMNIHRISQPCPTENSTWTRDLCQHEQTRTNPYHNPSLMRRCAPSSVVTLASVH